MISLSDKSRCKFLTTDLLYILSLGFSASGILPWLHSKLNCLFCGLDYLRNSEG